MLICVCGEHWARLEKVLVPKESASPLCESWKCKYYYLAFICHVSHAVDLWQIEYPGGVLKLGRGTLLNLFSDAVENLQAHSFKHNLCHAQGTCNCI